MRKKTYRRQMGDTGSLWREIINPQVGVASPRKGAIFPNLLTFPSEASLWKVLANHKSHAHRPFLAKHIHA